MFNLFDGGVGKKFPVQWNVVRLNISINECLTKRERQMNWIWSVLFQFIQMNNINETLAAAAVAENNKNNNNSRKQPQVTEWIC